MLDDCLDMCRISLDIDKAHDEIPIMIFLTNFSHE